MGSGMICYLDDFVGFDEATDELCTLPQTGQRVANKAKFVNGSFMQDF